MSRSKALFKELNSVFAAIVIPLSAVAAYFIYHNILGDPSNFVEGNLENEPVKGNYLGTIHKGGPIVILLITFQVVLITFILERFITVSRSRGKRRNSSFVRDIKEFIRNNQHDEAIQQCDQQKGSVANVVKQGIQSVQRAETNEEMNKESKVHLIQKELEEATQLELPHLNNNMIIISTLASISTLIGLLGTVTGMIKAFASLARVGAPDAVGLASGISQALVTTALGISTAAVAITFYNYFINRIDKITYAIDESSYSILNTFKAK